MLAVDLDEIVRAHVPGRERKEAARLNRADVVDEHEAVPVGDSASGATGSA